MTTSETNESRFFIALLPPEDVIASINEWKNRCKDHFGSQAALRSLPHITLHMPFRWKTKKEAVLFTALERVAHSSPSFTVTLNGFGAFPPRVIFIAVENHPLLMQLQKEVIRTGRELLKLEHGNYRKQAFHPHITVAFRDLKKHRFNEAREFFEKRAYTRSFVVRHLYVMQNQGERWEVAQSFRLQEKPD